MHCSSSNDCFHAWALSSNRKAQLKCQDIYESYDMNGCHYSDIFGNLNDSTNCENIFAKCDLFLFPSDSINFVANKYAAQVSKDNQLLSTVVEFKRSIDSMRLFARIAVIVGLAIEHWATNCNE